MKPAPDIIAKIIKELRESIKGNTGSFSRGYRYALRELEWKIRTTKIAEAERETDT